MSTVRPTLTHADRSAAAVVSPDEQLLILVVGGAPEVVGSLQPLIAERGGYAIGFVSVEHSPEAQEKIAGGEYTAVVVFDDLTGRSVLRDLTEFNRQLPVIAIIGEPDPAARTYARTEMRRAGAWSTVFREDLCGASLEQAVLGAVESYRLAVGLDSSSNTSFERAGGMLNEPAFMRRLRAVIESSESETDAGYSLIWIDAAALRSSGVLDHELLSIATATLQERIVTAAGAYLAAAFPGDHYAVLVTHRRDVEDVEVLEQIRRAVGRPLPAGTDEIYADIGVGIARGATVDPTAEDAVIRARGMVVYPATGVARTGVPDFISASATEQARLDAATTEQALRGAQARGELSMKYQPILDIAGEGATLGFEALLRWDQPDGESRAAADFIQVAEQSDLIVSLGYWALEAAVVQLAEWTSDFELDEGLFVAVNLSGRQVSDQLLPNRVQSLLMTTGTAAKGLRLEVSAACVAEQSSDFAALARGLERVGVGVWIQDFGGGSCDVGALRGLPIQGVKLSRRITGQLDGTSRTSGPVLHAMTAARTLGASVVAEGVENALQANVLRQNGCTVAQGYHYDRPLGVGEVFARLAGAS